MSRRIDRRHYADLYGPTTGDRVRLGDTALIAEVERDLTSYGDECKFGGGKVLRDGQGQKAGASGAEALDCVITNALILDWTGIYKADVGIKDGRIAGIGRAGSPAISDGIDLVVGPHTKSYGAYGLIATPGGVDSHVHTIDPELLPPALAAGVTTFITAGFEEPPFAMERVLAGLEAWPINIGMQAGARAPTRRPLRPAPTGTCQRRSPAGASRSSTPGSRVRWPPPPSASAWTATATGGSPTTSARGAATPRRSRR